VSPLAGWFFMAYAAVIMLGSVHLAWHYAIDGYAGIAIAFACWWVAGPISRWFTNLAATRRYNEGLASL
jgi:membrane-associated phospholipid phosphatase